MDGEFLLWEKTFERIGLAQFGEEKVPSLGEGLFTNTGSGRTKGNSSEREEVQIRPKEEISCEGGGAPEQAAQRAAGVFKEYCWSIQGQSGS